MKKYLLIFLLIVFSVSVKAQLSEFYKRKTTDKIDLSSGMATGTTVKITDSIAGGMWMQATRYIPKGTTVRYAVAAGWLVVTGIGGVVPPIDPTLVLYKADSVIPGATYVTPYNFLVLNPFSRNSATAKTYLTNSGDSIILPNTLSGTQGSMFISRRTGKPNSTSYLSLSGFSGTTILGSSAADNSNNLINQSSIWMGGVNNVMTFSGQHFVNGTSFDYELDKDGFFPYSGTKDLGYYLHYWDTTYTSTLKTRDGYFETLASAEQSVPLTTPNWTLTTGWQYGTSPNVLDHYANGSGYATMLGFTPISGARYRVVITLGSSNSFPNGTYYIGGVSGNIYPDSTIIDTVTTINTTAFKIQPPTTSRFKVTTLSIKKLTGGTAVIQNNLLVNQKSRFKKEVSFGMGDQIKIIPTEQITGTDTNFSVILLTDAKGTSPYSNNITLSGEKEPGFGITSTKRDGQMSASVVGTLAVDPPFISMALIDSTVGSSATLWKDYFGGSGDGDNKINLGSVNNPWDTTFTNKLHVTSLPPKTGSTADTMVSWNPLTGELQYKMDSNVFRHTASGYTDIQNINDTVTAGRSIKFSSGVQNFIISPNSDPTKYSKIRLGNTDGSFLYTGRKPTGYGGDVTQFFGVFPGSIAFQFDVNSTNFGHFSYNIDEYGFYPNYYSTAGTWNQFLGTPDRHWKGLYVNNNINFTALSSGAAGDSALTIKSGTVKAGLPYNAANWNSAYTWSNPATTPYTTLSAVAAVGYAPLASPSFTGTVTVNGYVRVGNGADSIAIDKVRGIRLYGNATVWNDYLCPIVTGQNAGSSYPLFSDTSNLYHFVVDTTGVTKCMFFGNQEMSHGWKIASDLHPHIHYKYTTTGGTPTFVCKYRWVNIGSVPGAWTWIRMGTTSGTTNNTIQMVENISSNILGSGKTLSSTLQYQIYLLSQTGTGGIDVQMFGIHYEIDAMGSKDELSQ